MPPGFEQYFNSEAPLPALYKMYRDLIRARQKLYAVAADASLRQQGKQPRFPIEFTSQFGEDLICWDLLGGATSGFFIEAGAFDGYRFSVTYPFEAVGWTGLLVEPHPVAYSRCVARRPNSRVVNAALGGAGAEGETDFITVADDVGGVMSHLPGFGHDTTGASAKSVRVPLTSLNRLLAEHTGIIDLLVLDIEGAEITVLQDFDFQRFRPRLMMIETEQRAALSEWLAQRSYVMAGVLEMNTIFIRNDQEEMFERLRWLML